MNLRVWPRMGFWSHSHDVPPSKGPHREPTNGEAERLADHQQRIVNNEKRLDWLSQRVKRLEALIAADTIAPVDPAEDGQSR